MDPDPIKLTQEQMDIAYPIRSARMFLTGPAGCGKTTIGVERLYRMLTDGIPADQILVLTPQRSLASAYHEVLSREDIPPGGMVDILTMNGLAQRMINLFWAMVAPNTGFASVAASPNYLTIETAQYYMAKIVEEKRIHEGYFASVKMDPHRLYSQLLDNLNKAALVGFPYVEIGERLKSAWSGPTSQLRVYDQAQECINLFREFCLKNQLLDYSLQMELFYNHLWESLLCRQYLIERYPHLLVDNLEEDTPATHDVLLSWLPSTETALIICDQDAGYRQFLGADPQSAERLAEICDEIVTLNQTLITPEPIHFFVEKMAATIRQKNVDKNTDLPIENLAEYLEFATHHFFPQMLDACAETVHHLVQEEHVLPDQIAILAPFMPETLRFSLTHRLEELDIPVRTIRPSRSLRDEAYVRCLLTLAKLAHPDWYLAPHIQDVIHMLHVAIEDMDLPRATHLGKIIYRRKGNQFVLSDFNQINLVEKEKITYVCGGRYDQLREWIDLYQQEPVKELDIFLRRVFGEVLSQAGFGYHTDPNAGEITANLIESATKFRLNIQNTVADDVQVGKEFLLSVENGLVAAQYLRQYQQDSPGSVFLAPAHTYLMQNKPVDVQIWLDIGSNGWWERLEQPLTHPYVLSRSWYIPKKWTDTEEYAANQNTMFRIAAGLMRRCRKKIYFHYNEINEQGFTQQGELLKVLQTSAVKSRYYRHDKDGQEGSDA